MSVRGPFVGAEAIAAAGQGGEAFSVRFRWADLPLRRFRRAAWARGLLRTGVMPLVAWAGVAAVSVLAAEGVERLAGPRGVGTAPFVIIGAAVGAVALFGGFILRWSVMMRAMRAAEIASAYRAGPHEVTLGPQGVRMVSAHGDCRFGWPAVSGVVAAPGGFILMLGTEDWLPVPAAGLPPGLTVEAAMDRVHGWMNA